MNGPGLCSFRGEEYMRIESLEQIDPVVLKIQTLLQKIDHLRLPMASRRDVESILVRQVARELDRALPWQAGHSTRTALIACRIGLEVGLDIAALHHLRLAALLHDIGLLMLPIHLQTGNRMLAPESYVAVQNHSRVGASLLEPFTFLREASLLIAHHHERWDGSGYPYGIRCEFIPFGARILAIADAFEAIQVPNVRDRALRDRIAFRILRISSGTQFDPDLVETLIHIETRLSDRDVPISTLE
jgi:HD-GYP domain-containing protein (c-di-GMP phosphodiesterase class II)